MIPQQKTSLVVGPNGVRYRARFHCGYNYVQFIIIIIIIIVTFGGIDVLLIY